MENSIRQVDGLSLLRKPFPDHQISLLPRPTKKDNPKGSCRECGGYHGLPAVHLKYVGHAALTDRLLDADPLWTWEPLSLDSNGLPAFDKTGGLWIKLTVCGVTRLGYGNAQDSEYKEVGAREKEVIGDALRNAAMRFGAALDLWHKGELHAHIENEESIKPTATPSGGRDYAGNIHPAKGKTVIPQLDNSEPIEPDMITMPSGEYKGHILRDIPTKNIKGFLKYIEETLKKGGKLTPDFQHAYEASKIVMTQRPEQ